MAAFSDAARVRLRPRGFILEYLTLGWNVAGVVVLAIAAISARSVALAGFGLDSLIEIAASVVVVWELSGTGQARQQPALRLIGLRQGGCRTGEQVLQLLVLPYLRHPRQGLRGDHARR